MNLNIKKICTNSLIGIFTVALLMSTALTASAITVGTELTAGFMTDQLINPGFERQGSAYNRAYDWQDFGSGYKRTIVHHNGTWGIRLNKRTPSDSAGAYQRIDLHQTEIKPVFIGAFLKGLRIVNSTDSFLGASIYAEIVLDNGQTVYWNSIRNEGTFNWRWIGFNTGTVVAVNRPIDHIFVVPVLNGSIGRAYFDDIQVTEYDPTQSALTIAIDDGEDSTYTAAKPIMDKYGFVGSAAIITEMVDEDGFMTWDQLRELQSSGWEIVSHSVTHSDLTTLSKLKLRKELLLSKKILEVMGLEVNNFAIPYGAYNGEVLGIGAKYYKSMRLYEQGTNPQGAFPFDVKVRGTLNTTTPEEVAAWIQEAKNNNRWVVLTFHKVTEVGDDAYYMTPERFDEVMSVIADSGINVVTYNDGLEMFQAHTSDGNTVFVQ